MKTGKILLTLIFAIAVADVSSAQPKQKNGYLKVNGLKYYYQITGDGEPLLLLHGGLGHSDMFAPTLPLYSKNRQVITVDLHGHGRTQLGERKINIIDMGNDMSAIVKQLGYNQVDVLGYSMGGEVAFRFAAQHPEQVRRLVMVSTLYAQNGFYTEMLPQQAQVGAAMADAMKDTPMYKSYTAVAPNPAEFPKLLDAMGEWMRTDYDWSADISKLTMPVMLIYGDSDMIRLEHVVAFYQKLGGGLKDAGWQREHMSKNRLAILPDLTHYEIFLSPMMATVAMPFLNGVSGAAAWEK